MPRVFDTFGPTAVAQTRLRGWARVQAGGWRAMWTLTAGLVDFEIFRCLSSGSVQATLDDEVTAVEGAVVIGPVLRKLTNVCHGSWRSIRSKSHPDHAELRVYLERHWLQEPRHGARQNNARVDVPNDAREALRGPTGRGREWVVEYEAR